MDPSRALALRFERHESATWARCLAQVSRASESGATKLTATTVGFGGARVFAMQGLDSFDVNRVLGLGLEGPTTPTDVEAIVDIYRSLGLSRYQVEVVEEVAAPCGPVLEAAGLVRHRDPIWTIYLDLQHIPPLEPDMVVQVLGPADRHELTELQGIAWGLWELDDAHELWFSACLGAEGFTYFGTYDEGVLVSVGALYVDGPTAWGGFDATLPRLRRRHRRRALSRHRLRLAADLGCELIHADAYDPPRLRTWSLAYRKIRWVSRDT